MIFLEMISGKVRRALSRRSATAVRGERLVARYLKQRGYRVLATNVRFGHGEIDIVAEAPDRRTIAVVEVKSCAARHAARPPEIRVNQAKRQRLVSLATALVRRHGLTRRPVRFDVAGVDLEDAVVRYHAGAFESHV